MSSAPGTAQLALNENAELNALVRGPRSELPTETVTVVTLDECRRRYDWREIDFLKIDAEGEESNIIRGGRQLLAESSPLILYEVKAGLDLHLELIREFAALGFDSYRLVPGLDLLVPFDAASRPDAYLLNLFCCKPDRASKLAQRQRRQRCIGMVRDEPGSGAAPDRAISRVAIKFQPHGEALHGGSTVHAPRQTDANHARLWRPRHCRIGDQRTSGIDFQREARRPGRALPRAQPPLR